MNWSLRQTRGGSVRPKYAIIENSPNVLAGDNGRWFARMLRDLAALGYDAEWHCISASYLGAPHERNRVWIIATNPDAQIRQGPYGILFGWGQQLTRENSPLSCEDDSSREIAPQRGIAHIRQWALECAQRTWPETWDSQLASLRDMDDGISCKLHGAVALRFGNAVVPQIPEMIGNAILAAEARA